MPICCCHFPDCKVLMGTNDYISFVLWPLRLPFTPSRPDSDIMKSYTACIGLQVMTRGKFVEALFHMHFFFSPCLLLPCRSLTRPLPFVFFPARSSPSHRARNPGSAVNFQQSTRNRFWYTQLNSTRIYGRGCRFPRLSDQSLYNQYYNPLVSSFVY